MVSLDNAVCAPGNHSIEDGVTIPMLDMTGPFDYHLTRHLCRLCEQHGIPYARDLFRCYRSDVAAALEAGAETRAALVAFGVDASHGAERTHVDSIEAVARLLCAYLLSPLTFARWDLEPQGDLRDFPSSRQPAPTERFGELPEDPPGEYAAPLLRRRWARRPPSMSRPRRRSGRGDGAPTSLAIDRPLDRRLDLSSGGRSDPPAGGWSEESAGIPNHTDVVCQTPSG